MRHNSPGSSRSQCQSQDVSPVLCDEQKGDTASPRAGTETPRAGAALCSVLRPTVVPRSRVGVLHSAWESRQSRKIFIGNVCVFF